MSQDPEAPVVIQNDLHPPMLGVLHRPADGVAVSGTGVLIVNGGAQYRAGAHRLFVQLARHLSAQGHAVLRFDFPGQGDSPGEPVSFENTAPQIGSAIDALHQHCPPLQRTVLLGLCDGASASLLYLHARPDRRVALLALLNPWVRSEATLARTQVKHYYRRRLFMPDFWQKLLAGDVGMAALREFCAKTVQALRAPTKANLAQSYQDRMAEAWLAFEGTLCVLLSAGDMTAQEFETHAQQAHAWRGWDKHPGLHIVHLTDADHTFSPFATQTALRDYILIAVNALS